MLLVTAAATPFSVRAEGDSPPIPEPVKPPWITGKNPLVSISSNPEEDLTPSGIIDTWQGVEVPLLAAPPSYVDLEPQGALDSPPGVRSLAIPQRYQNPSDVTCGAAALGMALEFLSLTGEGQAPSQETLVGDLKNSGLLYETGTGVEELAYLARQHGYQGTTAFHDWSQAQLKEQLDTGIPVVVSLGSNGENQAGHFVTLTGISADGKWVSYNDPILGKQTVPADDFQKLRDLQGNAGLVARKEPLSVGDDPMLPWMGLLGAMSTLAVLAKYYPHSAKINNLLSILQRVLGDPRRKGLGGKLVPVYEWQEVQDGTKVVQDTSKKIYEYGTRMVQNGVKTVTNYSKKIYEYGTRMVQNGWKTVKNYGKKIYEYGTRWVTKGWKKVTSWAKGIWGWFKKSKWVPKKVKEKFVKGWHYATKKVPKMVKETFVKGWHYATKTVPNMVKETFVKGWHYATKKVPKMVKETFVTGWHYATKEVPKYVWQEIQVGWKEVAGAAMQTVPSDPTPETDPANPTTPTPPTPTVTPQPVQTPEPEGTVIPQNLPYPDHSVDSNPIVKKDGWEEYAYVDMDGEVFVQGAGDANAIDPNDINQGDIGDCYLISAIAEIALIDPELIGDLITDNGDGTYSVNLYQRKFFGLFGDMIPNPITITDEIPTSEGQFVFAKLADPDELWPMLLEKAFAADNGSYRGIEGGWGNQAMEQLTGMESEKYNPDKLTINQLDDFQQQNYAMTASSVSDWSFFNGKIDFTNLPDEDPLFTGGTLIPDHEYYIVDIDKDDETITVANPWPGHREATLTLEEFQRAFQRLSINTLMP